MLHRGERYRFPVSANYFPVSRESIPRCGRIDSLFRRTGNSGGASQQITEFVDIFETDLRTEAPDSDQIRCCFPVMGCSPSPAPIRPSAKTTLAFPIGANA